MARRQSCTEADERSRVAQPTSAKPPPRPRPQRSHRGRSLLRPRRCSALLATALPRAAANGPAPPQHIAAVVGYGSACPCSSRLRCSVRHCPPRGGWDAQGRGAARLDSSAARRGSVRRSSASIWTTEARRGFAAQHCRRLKQRPAGSGSGLPRRPLHTDRHTAAAAADRRAPASPRRRARRRCCAGANPVLSQRRGPSKLDQTCPGVNREPAAEAGGARLRREPVPPRHQRIPQRLHADLYAGSAAAVARESTHAEASFSAAS